MNVNASGADGWSGGAVFIVRNLMTGSKTVERGCYRMPCVEIFSRKKVHKQLTILDTLATLPAK